MRNSILAMLLLFAAGAAAQVTLTQPANGHAPAVYQGQTYQFTATCTPSPCAWSLTGLGTINASTGLYTAPASVAVPNAARGVSLLALNNIYNVDIASLPVHARSANWVARVNDLVHYTTDPGQAVNFPFGGFPTNIVDGTTPTQVFHGEYATAPQQDLTMPMPQPPSASQQSGYYYDDFYGYGNTGIAGGRDRHLLSLDNSGNVWEIYYTFFDFATTGVTTGATTVFAATTKSTAYTPQNPVPIIASGATGDCVGINKTWQAATVTRISTTQVQATLPFNSTGMTGCSTAIINSFGYDGSKGAAAAARNTAGMYSYSPGSNWSGGYTVQAGSVDAAGDPFTATLVHPQEVISAIVNSQPYLLHALRLTFENVGISERMMWPAWTGNGIAHMRTHITGATNASPAVITGGPTSLSYKPCPGFTYTIGCQFVVAFEKTSTTGWTSIYGGSGCDESVQWNGPCYKILHVIDDGTGKADLQHWQVYNLDGTPFDSTALGSCCSPGQLVWDADWQPYGARWRLKSGFVLSNVCNTGTNDCLAAKLLLRTLQHYGAVMLDGGPNYEMGMETNEYIPAYLIDGLNLIKSYFTANFSGQFFDIVDQTSLIVDPAASLAVVDYNGLRTPVNQTTVTATAADSLSSASVDVTPIGIAVQVPRDKETIAANYGNFQLNPVIIGSTDQRVTCSISPAVGSITSGCLYTPPVTSTTQTTQVTITSVADSTKQAFVQIDVVPVDGSNVLRLGLGQWGATFTDEQSNVWQGALTPITTANFGVPGSSSNPYDRPGLDGSYIALRSLSPTCTTWLVNSNDALYYSALWSGGAGGNGDIKVHVSVPNGNYIWHLYGEPGYYADTNTHSNRFILEVGGVALGMHEPFVDLGGGCRRLDLTGTVTVSNGSFDLVTRTRGWGNSISSLSLTPGGNPVTAACPVVNGVVGNPYSVTCTATGGTPPYTWALTSGHLPTGLTGPGATTGVIQGTPLAIGTFTFTVTATDSASHSDPEDLSVDITRQTNNGAPPSRAPVAGHWVPR